MKMFLKMRKKMKKIMFNRFIVSQAALWLVFCLAWHAHATSESVKVYETEKKAYDILSSLSSFKTIDERLILDTARAHYNMGNVYFNKGEFKLAAREYYQAVTLMPNDPDVHYNLAYVSSERLRDYQTALKHYRMYLYLNPGAKDSDFVHEKIVEANLFLNNVTNSPLESDNQHQLQMK